MNLMSDDQLAECCSVSHLLYVKNLTVCHLPLKHLIHLFREPFLYSEFSVICPCKENKLQAEF